MRTWGKLFKTLMNWFRMNSKKNKPLSIDKLLHKPKSSYCIVRSYILSITKTEVMEFHTFVYTNKIDGMNSYSNLIQNSIIENSCNFSSSFSKIIKYFKSRNLVTSGSIYRLISYDLRNNWRRFSNTSVLNEISKSSV